MFNADFFPTPEPIIVSMLEGLNVNGLIILEPSAGKGDIVDYLKREGAQVIACEKNEDLAHIVATKCKLLAHDFLTVTSEQISHINAIVMNPPFSEGVKHLLHAYTIAPAGCKIISLLNSSNLKNTFTNERKQLNTLVESYGHKIELGQCFEQSERKTGVEVVLITLDKPADNYKAEFEGFFTEEEEEEQANGIMSYNAIRDLVNRYVGAVKLYDEQLNIGVKMNNLLESFYGEGLTFSCSENGKAILRNEFKKAMQRAGWEFIFEKMDLKKNVTRGVRDDINKFIEQQTQIPFTMRNIYRMIEIIIGTREQTMDRALLEVFEKLTMHHAENRYNVEGWKTNSHYLVNKRFIFPHGCHVCKYMKTIDVHSSLNETLDDFDKALAFITGENYDNVRGIYDAYRNHPEAGIWYDTHFFKVRFYKKGTVHCEFKDEELWGKFNQRIAKLKGFPLYEYKEQNKYQERTTGRTASQEKKAQPVTVTPGTTQHAKVLFEINL